MKDPEQHHKERELLRASLLPTLIAFAALVGLSGTALVVGISTPLVVMIGAGVVLYFLLSLKK